MKEVENFSRWQTWLRVTASKNLQLVVGLMRGFSRVLKKRDPIKTALIEFQRRQLIISTSYVNPVCRPESIRPPARPETWVASLLIAPYQLNDKAFPDLHLGRERRGSNPRSSA